MLIWRGLLLTSVICAAPLEAQSEAVLKEYFEGKTVKLKLAMPGTEAGVDLQLDAERPLDYPRYADRLKDNGTAIKAGQSAMVTKIRVKSRHIEFQLDGGGYGTMGDETSSGVNVGSAPKTKREQNLEGELKRETDPARRRAIKEEIDGLRRDREREDSRNRASVAEAEEHRKQNIRQRRLEGGSRFNLRYRDMLPASALHPEAVKAALAEYVEFDEGPVTPAVAIGGTQAPRDAPLALVPASGPRKGMLLQEADALLGTPTKSTERMEGKLKVVTRAYTSSQGKVTAEFVEGVLFRYTVTSD
jgi:hypothetical protein